MIRAALILAATLFAALPAHAAVDIELVESPGGIKAWLVHEDELPFTALEIRFRGGTSLDAEGKRGAINLMTGLIEEGAGDMDAQGFATALEALAADFDFSVGGDVLSVSAKFLNETRDESVALLKTALTEPRFDEDAIERVREQVLSGIRSDANDPATLAWAAFDAYAFPNHPYATSGDGTAESVAALSRDDLIEAHRRILTRDHIYVSAVGDITAEELGALLDNLLGDLPAEGAPYPDQTQMNFEAGVTVVPFDTPQSTAVFGHEGLERDDPDYFAAYVMNQILGGGSFTSRLFYELREKRGLTYGVYTYLSDWDYADVLNGQVKSANGTMAEAIELVRAEWQKLIDEGVTAEELEDAKTYLTGSYPLRFDGNGRIARILVGMQMIGLPPEYIETRNANIEAVTLEDIQRVAERVLQPDRLHFIVVGQPEGLETTN